LKYIHASVVKCSRIVKTSNKLSVLGVLSRKYNFWLTVCQQSTQLCNWEISFKTKHQYSLYLTYQFFIDFLAQK
jgi:hypothetical protein